MTKEATEIILRLLAHCEQQLEETIKNQRSSLTDTKQAGSAMTSRYDTFREEAEYRTTAFGVQAQKLQEAIRKLRQLLQANPPTSQKVVAGSLVTVEEEDNRKEAKQFLPVPDGGGFKANDVVTVNMQSPIGQALMRKQQGDDVILTNGGKSTIYIITEVK